MCNGKTNIKPSRKFTWWHGQLHTPLNTSDISRTHVLEYSIILKYEERLSKTKIIVMLWTVLFNIDIYFINFGFLQLFIFLSLVQWFELHFIQHLWNSFNHFWSREFQEFIALIHVKAISLHGVAPLLLPHSECLYINAQENTFKGCSHLTCVSEHSHMYSAAVNQRFPVVSTKESYKKNEMMLYKEL